jgi:hypothetical protein
LQGRFLVHHWTKLFSLEDRNIELIDLRHDQQRFGVLFFHGLVLDELQQLIAKHHSATGGRRIAPPSNMFIHGWACR